MKKLPIEIAKPVAVPSNVAVCPECNGILMVQATTPDIRDIILDCKNDTRKSPHRNWQDEWAQPYASVRSWLNRGMKERKLGQATLVALRTANGFFEIIPERATIGKVYTVDLNRIFVGGFFHVPSQTLWKCEVIEVLDEGYTCTGGLFWPWPTELLKFERPGEEKKPLSKPGELFKL